MGGLMVRTCYKGDRLDRGHRLQYEAEESPMPWNKTCPMNERLKFIADWLKGKCPIIHLARSYSVSRKTAHKWIRRYRQDGLYGLDEVSRAPKTHPLATPPTIEKEVLAFRRLKPFWGPRKLRHRLMVLQPDKSWPSASTIGAILKRHGLSKSRPARHRSIPPCPTGRSVA